MRPCDEEEIGPTFAAHISRTLDLQHNTEYIEKATASAADLWDPRLGCLDAWMLVFLLAWWQIGYEFESHFEGL